MKVLLITIALLLSTMFVNGQRRVTVTIKHLSYLPCAFEVGMVVKSVNYFRDNGYVQLASVYSGKWTTIRFIKYIK